MLEEFPSVSKIVTPSLVILVVELTSVPAVNVTVVCAKVQSVPVMHRTHMTKNVFNE